MPEIQGYRPLFDFLHAVASINSKFTGYWEGRLSEIQMKNDTDLPGFSEFLNYFRNQERLTKAESMKISTGAFAATFQGQPLNNVTNNTNDSSSNSFQKKWLCGAVERWKDCLYINKSIRPKDWIPDAATQNSVEEKIKKLPHGYVRSTIIKIRGSSNDKTLSPVKSDTPVITPSEVTRASWITAIHHSAENTLPHAIYPLRAGVIRTPRGDYGTEQLWYEIPWGNQWGLLSDETTNERRKRPSDRSDRATLEKRALRATRRSKRSTRYIGALDSPGESVCSIHSI